MPEQDSAEAGGAVKPVDLRDWVDFSRDEARRTRVFVTEHLALDLWCVEPQQATGVLELSSDVTYTVIGGRSWFVTEEGEVGLDPLGSLLVPAGVMHGIDNRGADPLIVSASSAPPSADGVDEPVSDESVAVRDDEQYQQRRDRLRRRIGRVLGVEEEQLQSGSDK